METLPHGWRGAGPPLLLLSGLGARGTSWQPFLTRAAAGFRVLTLDLLGNGAAGPLPPRHSIRDMARDVSATLDALGLERIAVMGRSMGGMVAQELALMAPQRVSALVLSSTTGRADAHLAEVFRLWARMADEGIPAAVRHRSSMLWCLGSRSLQTRDRARAYLDARIKSDRPGDYAVQARACALHDALDRLSSLRLPTLVVAGDDDRLMPRPHGEALARAIPGAEHVTIPGSGHLAYLEAPERFAAETLGFLEGLAEPHSTRGARCPSSTTRS